VFDSRREEGRKGREYTPEYWVVASTVTVWKRRSSSSSTDQFIHPTLVSVQLLSFLPSR